MSQTVSHSLVEAILQTGVGYAIAIVLQAYIAPYLFHYQITVAQAIGVTLLFTVASFARQFFMRRLFNWCWQGK